MELLLGLREAPRICFMQSRAHMEKNQSNNKRRGRRGQGIVAKKKPTELLSMPKKGWRAFFL
jgi:hypothetical protein